ncbi:MAG: hypothetical protein H6555_08250 [Lewinellaceae bacterium]|nr:hypothetical protein [Lewinellaceae bacterium]
MKLGIWMDFQEALIVRMSSPIYTYTVPSLIEHERIGGGSRSKTPWGPMDKVSEGKQLERRKHQERAYFQTLWEEVKHAESLYVCGPAEAKTGFANFWEEQHGKKPALLAVETADKMTEPQKVAWMKAFFAQSTNN